MKMSFWDDRKLGAVYNWLMVLGTVLAIPAVVSALYLIQMSAPVAVVPLLDLRPPQILILTPMAISNGPTTFPVLSPFTLLLATIFLVCVGVDLLVIGWHLSFIRLARYTPGYNTLADLKKGISSLTHGTRRDRLMLTLFAAAITGLYVSFALFFLVATGIVPNHLLLIPVIPLILLSGFAYNPCRRHIEEALRRGAAEQQQEERR
ncbi:MAG: hypothetical protein ACTSP1_08415 [Candidatus Freyarchaeota archaeon]